MGRWVGGWVGWWVGGRRTYEANTGTELINEDAAKEGKDDVGEGVDSIEEGVHGLWFGLSGWVGGWEEKEAVRMCCCKLGLGGMRFSSSLHPSTHPPTHLPTYLKVALVLPHVLPNEVLEGGGNVIDEVVGWRGGGG